MNIKDKFEKYKIVPDKLNVSPLNVLNILYDTGAKVNLGNTISFYQAKVYNYIYNKIIY